MMLHVQIPGPIGCVPEDYVNRIGRVAGAGSPGTAVAFCSHEERPDLRSIEKLTRLAVPVIRTPAALSRRHDGAAATTAADRSTQILDAKRRAPGGRAPSSTSSMSGSAKDPLFSMFSPARRGRDFFEVFSDTPVQLVVR